MVTPTVGLPFVFTSRLVENIIFSIDVENAILENALP